MATIYWPCGSAIRKSRTEYLGSGLRGSHESEINGQLATLLPGVPSPPSAHPYHGQNLVPWDYRTEALVSLLATSQHWSQFLRPPWFFVMQAFHYMAASKSLRSNLSHPSNLSDLRNQPEKIWTSQRLSWLGCAHLGNIHLLNLAHLGP